MVTMKRVLYLVAFLAILAAIIVPSVIHRNASLSTPGQLQQSAAGVTTQTQPAPGGTGSATNGGDQGTPAAGQSVATSGLLLNAAAKPAASAKGAAPAETTNPNQNSPGAVGVRVGVAVVGINGKVLFPPTYVTIKPDNRWGYNALGALDAAGVSYSMLPTWYDWVETIDGESCQGVEGWMYAVDGEVVMKMADKAPMNDGDVVVWWYSQSMDQSPPTWSGLMASQH
jgi:hypothetical protein